MMVGKCGRGPFSHKYIFPIVVVVSSSLRLLRVWLVWLLGGGGVGSRKKDDVSSHAKPSLNVLVCMCMCDCLCATTTNDFTYWKIITLHRGVVILLWHFYGVIICHLNAGGVCPRTRGKFTTFTYPSPVRVHASTEDENWFLPRKLDRFDWARVCYSACLTYFLFIFIKISFWKCVLSSSHNYLTSYCASTILRCKLSATKIVPPFLLLSLNVIRQLFNPNHSTDSRRVSRITNFAPVSSQKKITITRTNFFKCCGFWFLFQLVQNFLQF